MQNPFNWIDRQFEAIAAFILDVTGNGFDPDGCALPSFAPPPKPATAKVPKKEHTGSKGGDWVGWDGGRVLSEDSKAIEFDNYADYGITEREYGEMLAYDPPLRSLEIASKVKAGKERGDTLNEIAKRLSKDVSLVKHYSAALYRAKNT
jgi:hypothetical protein